MEEQSNTYLSFSFDNEVFAVNVKYVLEVLQKQKVTHVPNAPQYIRGVINFRGDVVPIIKTRIKFGMQELDEQDKYVIIVLQIQQENEMVTIGAIADKVIDVLTIPANLIKPVPKMSSSFNSEFLTGISKINDRFIMLLDVDKIFSEQVDVLQT